MKDHPKNPMEERITLTTQLTRRDYRNFGFFLLYSGWRLWLQITIFVVMSSLIGYHIWSRDSFDFMENYLWLAFLLGLAYVPLAVSVKAKRYFETDKLLSEEQHYTISPQGIEIASLSANARLSWEKVHVIRESRESFFIFIARNKAFIVPKRNAVGRVNAIRSLFGNNLDAKKLKLRKDLAN